MGYWGWRPLMFCIFISVWVVGCTNQQLPTVTPSQSPPVTLIVRSPQPETPSVPNLRPQLILPTSTPPQTKVTPIPGTLDNLEDNLLELKPPYCYETADGGVLCLGTIKNGYAFSLESVVLLVEVFARDERLINTQEVSLVQRFIPAGGSAPYHVLFAHDKNMTQLFGAARTSLVLVKKASTEDMTFSSLVIEAVDGQAGAGGYTVSGNLRNLDQKSAEAIRLVVTLYDSEERITAFRALEIERLPPEETREFSIVLQPQITDVPFRYTVYIEKLR